MPKLIIRPPVCLDVFVELVAARDWLVPGCIAHKQDEEDNATGPDIHEITVIAFCCFLPSYSVAAHDFGRSIGWTSAACLADFTYSLVGEQCCEPEVGDFQVTLGGQEDIFRLDISMTHAFGVHESHCTDQLCEVEMCNVLPNSNV